MSLRIFAEIMKFPVENLPRGKFIGEDFRHTFIKCIQGGDAAQDHLAQGGEVLVLARDKQLRR